MAAMKVTEKVTEKVSELGAPLGRVSELGEYLREQRHSAQLSLRQLAEVAGVSNPYLSQVERGLRKPSAEVLQQIAKGLRISAEVLYVRAGILDERDDRMEVEAAVMADPHLTERQRQVLLDIYTTFRTQDERAHDGATPSTTTTGEPTTGEPTRDEPAQDEPTPAAAPARAASPARPATARTAGTARARRSAQPSAVAKAAARSVPTTTSVPTRSAAAKKSVPTRKSVPTKKSLPTTEAAAAAPAARTRTVPGTPRGRR